MTVWRWRTSGLPTWPGGRPETAFMPLITKTIGVGQAVKALLVGQPGTEAIPAANNDIPRDRLAIGEGTQYAKDFGGSWFPSLYYQENFSQWFESGDGWAAGARIFSDNQLPVPAIDPITGTSRFGGGPQTPAFMDPRKQRRPKRRVSKRHA